MAHAPRVASGIGLFGLIVGALLGLIGQAIPPFHVLGHELAQGFTVIAALVQLEIAAWAIRAFPYRTDRLEAAFLVSLAGVVGLGAGVHAVAALANELRYGCDSAGTGMFLWLTWGPLGALVSVLGLATAGWRIVPRAVGFFAVMTASIAHDQLRTDLGLTMADPLIGFLLALDQRAGIEMSAVQALQRGWLLGVALAGWSLLSWSHHRDPARGGVAAATCGAMIAVTLGWGGQLGIGLGRGAQRVLDGEVHTAHVRLRFDRSGPARHRVKLVAREAEWALHQLSAAWGLPLSGVSVTLDLYGDPASLVRATGRPFPHAGRRRAAMTWRDGLGEGLHHELVHAISGLAGHAPWQVDPSRGRAEGSAVAWTDGYAQCVDVHAPMALALRRGQLPSAMELMSLTGFWSVPEGTAYQASGSFVGFLVQRYGVPAWRTWLRTQSAERSFGRSLSQLDTEWRTFLSEIPVDLDSQRAAEQMFDAQTHRAATRKTCPKLGPRVPDRALEAESARRIGDHERALALFRAYHDHTGDEGAWWSQLGELQALERDHEVLQILDDAEDTDPLRRLDTRIRSWTALGDPDELRRAIGDRLLVAHSTDLAAVEELLGDPEVAPDVVAILQSDRDGEAFARAQRLLADLPGDRPERPDTLRGLAVLALDRAAGLPRASRDVSVSPHQKRRLEQVFTWLRLVPDPCEVDGARWLQLDTTLVQLGACKEAGELTQLLEERCTDRAWARRVGQIRDRLAWESSSEDGVPKACIDLRIGRPTDGGSHDIGPSMGRFP